MRIPITLAFVASSVSWSSRVYAATVATDVAVGVDATVSTDSASAGSASSIFGSYFLSESIVGHDFYNHFNWENISDPTHGRVVYVDEKTSVQHNLTYAKYNSFVLRTDNKAILDPDGPGRESVRIITKKSYTTHVAVFDVRHMPQGCGTWPAIWSTTAPPDPSWPNGGEVDIVEGVNDQGPNAATLHTTTGCTMPETRPQLGTPGQNDCDWLVNYNTGCTVKMSGPNTYGPSFNANGGGWFVTERTGDHISVWFWQRNDPKVPFDVKYGSPITTPRTWGKPQAFFPNTNCDFKKFFAPHHIIINLTLCGDWAGQADVYASSGCPSTCLDYVNNNPAAFSNAYFDFASVRIYQPTPFLHNRGHHSTF
ncbi:putative glycosidase C21B10.07 [Psilocybe cubensis]|uniref:Glycosidase C21B10.07 n=2 Tax=Psilocybe cubensis TaxID=181762 RepID=A0ACB8GIN0_PSICU|nr:putative glycosidase C21B10.07 [Psilocybe cubensis]KAH9475563.1 putative glycosidase C21B10.07 [Psilocybe cubensis]